MMSVVHPSENMAMLFIHFTSLSNVLSFNMTNANLSTGQTHATPKCSTSQVALCSDRDEFDKFIETEVDVTTHFLCHWLPGPLFRIENARAVRIKSL